MKLVIANKNYSSWSLRSWLALRHFEVPFEEIRVSFLAPDFKAQILRHSPSGRVPVLIDGDDHIWDSLAIAETLADRLPQYPWWPTDRRARALARSMCAEMHSGFTALRQRMPMNVTAHLPGMGWDVAVQRDIDRIVALWTQARDQFGAAGPFLFGAFSHADAYFAPVVARFRTHGVTVPAPVQTYMAQLWQLPAMRQWVSEAAEEREFVVDDEPYRTGPSANGGRS